MRLSHKLAALAGATLVALAVTAVSLGVTKAAPSNTSLPSISGSAPKNTSPPTISGTPQEDQTLTASNGGWTGAPAPTFSYTWQRCAGTGGNCTDIPGATAQTYKLTSADVAHTVRVNVVAKNTH